MTWHPSEGDFPDTIKINGATFVKYGEYIKYPPIGMTKQDYVSSGIRLSRCTSGYCDGVKWEAHLLPKNRNILPTSSQCSSPEEAVTRLRESFDQEVAEYKEQLSCIMKKLRSLEEDGEGLMIVTTSKENV